MRPLVTILADTLSWYGVDEHGGRVHDLLGTGCDPYINAVLTSAEDSGADGQQAKHYDFHCRSNLTRAVLPYGLVEHDVHDVINLFQYALILSTPFSLVASWKLAKRERV